MIIKDEKQIATFLENIAYKHKENFGNLDSFLEHSYNTGKNAEEIIWDYNKNEQRDLCWISREIENIETDLSAYVLDAVKEKYTIDALNKIISYRFIAQRMIQGIKDNHDNFNEIIYEKQKNEETITSDDYIDSLISIVNICKTKYEELNESYLNVLGDPETRKDDQKKRMEDALKN